MSDKIIEYFYLPPKEEAVMRVLWDTEEALSASEIAEKIPNRTWPASSVQNILRNLESKNAIKIDSIVKLGKSYGRLFRPTLSANDYAAMQLNRYYQSNEKDCFSMVSSLLGNTFSKTEKAIDILQSLIKEYEKKE